MTAPVEPTLHICWRLACQSCGTLVWQTTGAEYCTILPNPAHFPTHHNYRPDILDITVIRTSAVPTYIGSVEEWSSYHDPVILVMELHYQGWTRLQSVVSSTGDTTKSEHLVSRRNRRWNNHIYFNNKVSKKISKPYNSYPLRDSAIRDLEELVRRKRQGTKNMQNFNRAADCRQ
jgi:hypothetical protein